MITNILKKNSFKFIKNEKIVALPNLYSENSSSF